MMVLRASAQGRDFVSHNRCTSSEKVYRNDTTGNTMGKDKEQYKRIVKFIFSVVVLSLEMAVFWYIWLIPSAHQRTAGSGDI